MAFYQLGNPDIGSHGPFTFERRSAAYLHLRLIPAPIQSNPGHRSHVGQLRLFVDRTYVGVAACAMSSVSSLTTAGTYVGVAAVGMSAVSNLTALRSFTGFVPCHGRGGGPVRSRPVHRAGGGARAPWMRLGLATSAIDVVSARAHGCQHPVSPPVGSMSRWRR